MTVEYISENYPEILRMIAQHLTLFGVSTVIAIVAGVAVSIAATREGHEKTGRILLSISGMAQAVPSIAVVALVFLLVGIGMKPAIVALILYSLVPVIFNTSSGLLSVNAKTIEAAKGIGYTKNQILWKIKFPIALPVVIAGVRSAATINIGTATIASVIGGGGLGDLIFIGIKLQKSHITVIGALLTAIIAVAADIAIQQFGKRITPKGLRLSNNYRSIYMKKNIILILLLCAVASFSFANGRQEKASVTIGAKNFTEQYVVGNLMALLLEENGFKVKKQFGTGSSITREGLVTARRISMPNIQVPHGRFISKVKKW